MDAWKRSVCVLAAGAAIAWLNAAGVAAGGNPGRTPLPTPPDVSGLLCGSAVGNVVAHVSANREYIKTYSQADGTTRFEINGFAAATVTGNGKTLSFNEGGPATVWVRPDGTVTDISYGHAFVIGPFGPDTGILLYTGRLQVDVVNGVVTGNTGHVTDVCAMLT